MLVAVLMVFVIFSFTSVADLNISYLANSDSRETAHTIKLQYEIESRINKAMWRINSGDDESVNMSSEGASVSWDPQLGILSIGTENDQTNSEVQLDLSENTPFSRALASKTRIKTYGYHVDIEEEHSLQQVDLLPELDPSYFIINRAIIHHGNQDSWSKQSLQIEGIHIFLGNNLEISDLNLENSTLLFLGDSITFNENNIVKAPVPLDSLDAADPALVFMNPSTEFTLKWGTQVEGAIYCAGHLDIENATLTGPVVSNSITLTGNVDFIDDQHPEYYRWTRGFGNQDDYDWPKHVDQVRSTNRNKTLS